MSGPLRVAVLGAGTVGREVVRALIERPETLLTADGAPLELHGVAVRDMARAVAGGIPDALLTDAPAHLVADPAVDIVVELMGGDEPARTLIAAALGAGKSVVTANKHVLAHHGLDFETTARRTGATLRFEAAVGGGTPVLGALALDLAANRIDAVRGIVNGTTNFILTAMATEGRAYADVLADAQRAGYAEADPRGDVEGEDAANKLSILARQAFGQWLDVRTITRAPVLKTGGPGPLGITGVTFEDIAAAAEQRLAVKLIAAASRSGGSVLAAVLPTAVALEAPLGRTDGVLNRIEVDGEPVGRVAFVGPGAGGPATSSAVLGDLIAIARGVGSTWAGHPSVPGLLRAARPVPNETFDGPSGLRYPVIR
ncbi:MAG: homoserine dehydrogenase [Chloroflexota bacterium]